MGGWLTDVGCAWRIATTVPSTVGRLVRNGRYREDITQRLGGAPLRRGTEPLIWIHGSSMGEINSTRSLVAEIHRQLPDFLVSVSAATDTGMTAARKHFHPGHVVFRFPMDFTFAVCTALNRLRPTLMVIIENELYPNFLDACARRGVRSVVVNGRLGRSDGSARIDRIRREEARRLSRVAAIGAQDEQYVEQFLAMGLDPEKIHLTGMLKYDSADVADHIDGQEELADALGIGRGDELIVAGSTGPGEEELLLDLFAELLPRRPAAKLAIAPRLPGRFEEVAKLIAARGLPLVRRSRRGDGTKGKSPAGGVILGDTICELRKFYALASAVFIGRTLVPMGGSDMMEAAALGKPTCFGPHAFNFPQAEQLAENGCVRVPDPSALRDQLWAWLDDPAAAGACGRRAQDFVRSQQGASKRNVEMIRRVLGR